MVISRDCGVGGGVVGGDGGDGGKWRQRREVNRTRRK